MGKPFEEHWQKTAAGCWEVKSDRARAEVFAFTDQSSFSAETYTTIKFRVAFKHDTPRDVIEDVMKRLKEDTVKALLDHHLIDT